MTCIRMGGAILCVADVYEYKGFIFEWHDYLGPSPLRKDGEPMVRVPESFWVAMTEFSALPDKERYRVQL